MQTCFVASGNMWPPPCYDVGTCKATCSTLGKPMLDQKQAVPNVPQKDVVPSIFAPCPFCVSLRQIRFTRAAILATRFLNCQRGMAMSVRARTPSKPSTTLRKKTKRQLRGSHGDLRSWQYGSFSTVGPRRRGSS